MRMAEGEYDHPLALHFRAVSDADDVQFAGPALGDAFDSVVHQSAGEAVNGSLRIVVADGEQFAIFLFHADAAGKRSLQLALGTLHVDYTILDFHRHTLGDGTRLFSNS